MKKVIFVVANLDVGGAEIHVAHLVSQLDSEKYKAVVFCMINKGVLAANVEADGITVNGPKVECNWYMINRFMKLWCVLKSSVRLLYFLRDEKTDIVHFFLPMPYLVGGIVSLFSGVKYRVISRRSLNVYQKNYYFVAQLEWLLHKTMSRVLGNSKAIIDELRQEGISNRQLCLIYNGVDIPELISHREQTYIRDRIGIGRDEVVITIVANLIPYKGHEDLLRGVCSFGDELPKNWKVLCVGNDSHGIRSSLVALSVDLGIANHVTFAGARNDVKDILLSSDLAVLCSHQEGFSNAVLEAMAAALPIVVTDVGGNAEAVRDGIDGYVVPAHSPLALGAAIAKILNNPLLKKEMGDSARERVRSHFSMRACVANYEKIYDEIIE